SDHRDTGPSVINLQLLSAPQYWPCRRVSDGPMTRSPDEPISMSRSIYTIGHSTRDLADFSRILQAHEIRVLEDIRAFPMSRRHPHFNRENLEMWLPQIGCDYVWEKDLGGRRKKQMPADQSPNIALRNESFRNYADYMLSPQFAAALDRLVERAARANTVI